MTFLPPDLYHHIIFYYVTDYKDLIFLRLINHEWKKIAESSLLWLSLPLTFYAPKLYLKHFFDNSHGVDQKLYAYLRNLLDQDQAEDSLKYSLFEPFKGSADLCKNGLYVVSCDFARERNDSTNPIIAGSKVDRFQQSIQICTWFLEVRRRHYEQWNEQIRLIKTISLVKEFLIGLRPIISRANLVFAVLDILAGYGIYTLQQNLQNFGKLHWENYLSFVCVDFAIILLLILHIIKWMVIVISNFPYKHEINIRKLFVEITNYHVTDLTALSIFGSLILLIVAEIGVCIPNFPWIILCIPCFLLIFYVFCRILSIRKYDEVEVPKKRFYFAFGCILLVSLSIMLFGLFADGYVATKYPYGLPLLPFFPFFIVLFISNIIVIKDCISGLLCRGAMTPALAGNNIYLGILSMGLNVLLLFDAFSPEVSTNSTISILPSLFVLYLYLNCTVCSFYLPSTW